MDKVSFNLFQQLDIRIGTVVSAEVPDWSHWVLKMKVDFGKEAGEKTSFAGIMKFFKPEELLGRQFPFVLNIKPKKIGPNKEESEAMMIMAVPSHEATDGKAVPKDDEETPPVLFKLDSKVENGTRVF